MKLEFKTYKINENSRTWEIITKSFKENNKPEPVNRFVIVGETGKNKEYWLAHHDDLLVLSNLKINETAYWIKKEDLTLIPFEYAEYDIPRKNLTMKIIEEIQRLNADE